MPILKPIYGYTDTKGIQNYLQKDKETGKRTRSVFRRLYNFPYIENEENWAEAMKQERLDYGTNDNKYKDKNCTYIHYVLSPNPKDNVTIEELDDFCREFIKRGLQTEEFGGRFSVATEFHNDNGILHAHLVVNNVNKYWGSNKETKRFTNYMYHHYKFISQLREQMAKERGWSNFLDKQEQEIYELAQGKVERVFRDSLESSHRESAKKYLDKDEAFFKENEILDNFTYYTRPKEKVIKGKVFVTKQGAYYTKAESERILRGEWSFKEDIRKIIEISLGVSNNEQDFWRCLAVFGVGLSINTRGDFNYNHFEEKGRVVSGRKLGSHYTREFVQNYFIQLHKEQYNYRKQFNYSALVSHQQKSQFRLRMEALGVTWTTRIATDDLQAVKRIIEINNKFNVWNFEDYDKLMSEADNDQDIKDLKYAKKMSKKFKLDRPLRAFNGRKKDDTSLASKVKVEIPYDKIVHKGIDFVNLSDDELRQKLETLYYDDEKGSSRKRNANLDSMHPKYSKSSRREQSGSSQNRGSDGRNRSESR